MAQPAPCPSPRPSRAPLATGPLNDVIPRTFAFEFMIEVVIEFVTELYVRIHWAVRPTSTQDPHYSVADATGSTLVLT